MKNLVRELAALGHDVTILTAHLPGTKKEEEVDGIKIVRFRTGRKSDGNASLFELVQFGFRAIGPTVKLIKKEQPDALLSIFLVPAGLTGVIAGRRTNTRHVTFIGGSDLPGVGSKFKAILGALRYFIRNILKRCDGVLVAEGLEEIVKDLWAKAEFTSVKNGTNIRQITPKAKTKASFSKKGPLTLLTIGRLIERKGFLYIVEAMRLLPEKVRQNLNIQIIGYGPLEEELEDLIAEYNLQAHVTLIGKVRPENLQKYYQNADGYIFYSQPEGNSLAMVEAAGYGLPLITSDVPGNRELINGNGILCKWGDEFSLATALKKFVDARNKLPDWSTKSRKIAKNYDWPAIASVYEKALQKP